MSIDQTVLTVLTAAAVLVLTAGFAGFQLLQVRDLGVRDALGKTTRAAIIAGALLALGGGALIARELEDTQRLIAVIVAAGMSRALVASLRTRIGRRYRVG